MAGAIYILCFVTSSLCALMLGRSWRRTGAGLLFWSAASFSLLAFNNLLVVVDLMVVGPDVDLQVPRMIVNLVAVAVLLFGFIWNGDD